MFELLAEIFASCWRFLKAELPDCVTILEELRSGRRSIPAMSRGYLWLCYLTGLASVVRGTAVVLFFTGIAILLYHGKMRWPPFNFDDSHLLYWGLQPPPTPFHFCVPLAVVTMTTFIVTALSYYGVARLSTELVGVVCPISETPAPPTKTARKKRRNEVA